jgi:hypothetical protein
MAGLVDAVRSMWRFLLSGRAHAYYGLMAIFTIALLLYALPGLRDHPIVYVAIMVLSAGIFVDLWAHKFAH